MTMREVYERHLARKEHVDLRIALVQAKRRLDFILCQVNRVDPPEDVIAECRDGMREIDRTLKAKAA